MDIRHFALNEKDAWAGITHGYASSWVVVTTSSLISGATNGREGKLFQGFLGLNIKTLWLHRRV